MIYKIDGKDRTIEFLEVNLRNAEETLREIERALDYTDVEREAHYPYIAQKFLVQYLKDSLEREKEDRAIHDYM